MHFVAHDLQRPKQIAGASQTQEKHRGAAVSRHAFSIWKWARAGLGSWQLTETTFAVFFSAQNAFQLKMYLNGAATNQQLLLETRVRGQDNGS